MTRPRVGRWSLVLALVLAVMGSLLGTTGSRVSAALPAPTPTSPGDGETVATMQVTVAWTLPAGTTQYHLQVVPINGDGPGIDLIRNAESWYTIPAAPYWYIMLPGMTYRWRIQATDKATPAAAGDLSWGPWSDTRAFRTPPPSSAGEQPVMPADGAMMPDARPVLLQWSHPDPTIFYFEVQVSKDPTFNTDPSTATSFVYWLLRHGAATNPPNSWRVPIIEPNTTYFWRVRPRVQGDGAPVAWGPTWSFSTPPLPKMAFTTDRDGNDEIYVLNSDGTLPMRLTNNRARDMQPAISPDRSHIAFVSDRDGTNQIYMMNADGSNQTRITNNVANDSQPAWSPDGSRIAFVSDRDGTPEVYVMNADGSGQSLLTNAPSVNTSPAWAPDGTAIAFVSNREGRRQIYLMRPDGSGPVNRSAGVAEDFDPAWSLADGQLAFVSTRDGTSQIYVMNADGSGQTRLTINQANDTHPAWAPDGSAIAFVSDRNGRNEIFLMQPDGSGQDDRTANPNGSGGSNPTANSANNLDPAWPMR